MLSTRTLAKFPDITFEDLIKARQDFLHKFGGFKSVLKCSPEAYIAIKDLALGVEHEQIVHQGILGENIKRHRKEPYKEPIFYWGSLFGIEIKLDSDLLPGEWKFE